MTAVLEADDVRVDRDGSTILGPVSLAVDPAETVLVQGESGAGKSTLFHVLALLDRPSAGRLRVDGADVGGLADRDRARIRRDEVGIVFQEFHLVPDLTAYENARLPQEHDGSVDEGWLDDLFDALGLTALRGRYPTSLSGGEKQRVAIARALANRPSVVLADEPTGQLDPGTSARVLDLLFETQALTASALLVISHDPALGDRFDRRYRLADGRLVRQ